MPAIPVLRKWADLDEFEAKLVYTEFQTSQDYMQRPCSDTKITKDVITHGKRIPTRLASEPQD